MYKSNSGLGAYSNCFLYLIKYIVFRKVVAIKSATTLIQNRCNAENPRI